MLYKILACNANQYFLFAFVRFFERPMWTFQNSNWNNNNIYPMSGVPLFDPNIIICIKIPLLLLLLIAVIKQCPLFVVIFICNESLVL